MKKPVGFLHRTVVEGLQIDIFWRQVLPYKASSKFDVDKALISSSLLEMKCKPPKTKQKEDVEIPPCFRSMLGMLTYQQNMEFDNDLMESFYRSEMMTTMDHYWGDWTTSKSFSSLSQPRVRGNSRPSRTLIMPTHFPFVISAACQCPTEYFQILLDLALAASMISSPMVKHEFAAYLLIRYLDEVEVPRRIALSKAIVAYRLSPNEALAENMCVLEDRMLGGETLLRATTYTLDHRAIPRAGKASHELELVRYELWDVTPRTRRVELLDPELQELTVQLAKTDLTARDQRSFQSKTRQFAPQVQSKTFECSQTLRQAKQNEAGCV